MIHCTVFFHTNYGLVVYINPDWPQGAFKTLIGLFNRVGLHTNLGKTFGMLYRPRHAVGTQLKKAYEQQIMGEGLPYWSRHRI